LSTNRQSPSEPSQPAQRPSTALSPPTEHPSSDSSPPTAQSTGISTKAKAGIATVTAVIGLATGILTLRDQIFGNGQPPANSATRDNATVAEITNDAEAKSRANRVSDALKECVTTTGRDYQGCGTAGILGAIHIPVGFGVGSVEVDVTSPASFELTSRSESGQVFRLLNTVEGEAVRSCAPAGTGGCPQDGRW
jgi:hypothetical protein